MHIITRSPVGEAAGSLAASTYSTEFRTDWAFCLDEVRCFFYLLVLILALGVLGKGATPTIPLAADAPDADDEDPAKTPAPWCWAKWREHRTKDTNIFRLQPDENKRGLWTGWNNEELRQVCAFICQYWLKSKSQRSAFYRGNKKTQDRGGPPFIRQSPSLPELSAQGIPWPEDLVDMSADIFAVFSKEQILTPEDGQAYDEIIKRWADNASRRAAIVVLPSSAQDVSKAVCFLSFTSKNKSFTAKI